MGSTRTASDNPQHTVYLDAFWIGKYDVTNALYKKCVDAGRCTAPYSWTDRNFPSGKENYPVAGVTWADAAAYAAWASARLPTEAEWEKAACWDEAKKAKRLYPWGNEFDRQKANTSGSLNYGTSPVGKYSPEGDSPYGLSDMAGNVWNWVADWYSDTYYSNPPLRNPKGADTGVERVMRGGSWYAINLNAQCPYRGRSDPSLRLDTIGFRIATSAP